MNNIPLTISRTGEVCSTAGGGAFTNTTTGTWWVNKAGILKPALFIKERGQLSNSNQQAVVPVEVGDFMVMAVGALPASLENPDFHVTVFELVKIEEHLGELVESEKTFPLRYGNGDFDPIIGLETYHNRDGRFFCRQPVPNINRGTVEVNVSAKGRTDRLISEPSAPRKNKLGLMDIKAILEKNGIDYESLPTIEAKSGSTGYICILPERVTSPIMKGKDEYDRQFITFRLSV